MLGIVLGIVIVSIVLHEIGHAYSAHLLGDPTAKQQGRLSINPLVHMDIIGSVLVPMLLWVTNSGVIFGWAKPVPVNMAYFKRPRQGMMAVAIAGPMVNFLLACIGWIGLQWMSDSGVYLRYGFAVMVYLNLILMVFNLIPIPPLDGARVINGILPSSWSRYWMMLDQYGMVILVLMLLTGGIDWVILRGMSVMAMLFPGIGQFY